MSHPLHPELCQGIGAVARLFSTLSKPQALGLALWSFGMILARSCSFTAAADMLAPLFSQLSHFLISKELQPGPSYWHGCQYPVTWM